ncbi:hypothetical protein AURDEDRAFT_55487 [Auricularia subglabra TFB-10046 SS5]|nr:hypothetical protein AURDEDRAFT_55487 [Auricularia subglabra TFB-10046 SS5]
MPESAAPPDAAAPIGWPGFEKIQQIFIFGDSYSAVGYSSTQPHPTPKDPIGLPLPGVTWTEKGGHNWVGYLLTTFVRSAHKPLVYCYAVGGDKVDGLRNQVERHFLRSAGAKPDWAPWTARSALFISWVGINDLGWGLKPQDQLEKLFALQEQLYAVGARNFVFIDVPPVNRFPARRENPEVALKYRDWNDALRTQVQGFREKHPDVAAFIWSSYEAFSRIMDSPAGFGFKADQVNKPFSEVWVDHIHPRGAVHKVVAKEIAEYLYNCAPIATHPCFWS